MSVTTYYRDGRRSYYAFEGPWCYAACDAMAHNANDAAVDDDIVHKIDGVFIEGCFSTDQPGDFDGLVKVEASDVPRDLMVVMDRMKALYKPL